MTVSEASRKENKELHTDGPVGMNVFLVSRSGCMYSEWLSYPPRGKGVFKDLQTHHDFAEIWLETDGSAWYVNCSRNYRITTNPLENNRKQGELYHQCSYRITGSRESYLLYAEESMRNCSVYHNYSLSGSRSISIGRESTNDIVYNATMISRDHAKMGYDGHAWILIDDQSANGTFVNGRQIPAGSQVRLAMGDMVSIMGLQIIAGPGVLSINDGNPQIHISGSLVKLEPEKAGVIGAAEKEEKELYNRLPRRRKHFKAGKISIEQPPMPMGNNRIPLALRIGSPLAMSAMSMMYGSYLWSLSSMIFPLFQNHFSEKQIKEYEERRILVYTKYLADKRKEIADELEKEQSVFNENYPDLDTVLNYSLGGKRLWERRKTDDDFLKLRVGRGTRKMMAELSYRPRELDLEEDELEKQMYDVAEAKYELKNFPVFVDLKKDRVVGITADTTVSRAAAYNMRIEFLKRMVMRAASLFSYDEVKMVFLMEPEELEKLAFVRYLPHLWDDQKSIRLLAVTDAEAYQVGDYLRKRFDEDLSKPKPNEDNLRKNPQYLVFCTSRRLLDCVGTLKQIMQSPYDYGVSFVCAYEDMPKECSSLITLGTNEVTLQHLHDLDQPDETFIPDGYDQTLAARSMHVIANTQLKVGSKAYALPKSYKFLNMFQVGRVEDLNVWKRWKESNPVKTLAAPVGVGEDGNLFMLDLHQKYQGPHGLVAGMTGSGKSEFLITYILSMAITYSPDEVAFLLIDYKGGGLAGAFEDQRRGIHLPHLVGTITNLDGSAINRSLVSLHSELQRRQRLFNKAKSIAEEGTMDIYDYQRLYRSGKIKELGPLPHLFIISDEFAELKEQQPDFLDELVSTARIGRSLGVHLILATQKPSGVVNDQIRSNTKFQVCLKVQDKGDSDDMIKRPDAAELKDVGRFYLQVGYNEYFALGQSAWSGADYTPADPSQNQQTGDENIELIDDVGEVIRNVKFEKKLSKQGTQLTAVVKYLSGIADQMDYHSRPLWKAPMPGVLELQDLIQEKEEDGSLIANIGMFDDPTTQTQARYDIDMIKDGNVLALGKSGSGKTIFLQSLLLSLSTKYTSEDIQYYILDYSSRGLKMFHDLPQCGAVLTDEEYDYVPAVFKLLDQKIAERKNMFEELGVNDFASARQVKRLPLILLVIDNLQGMEQNPQAQGCLDVLDHYVKQGTTYGIRFIVTAVRFNDVSYRLKQEISHTIAFRLNTPYDFQEIFDVRVKYMPADKPGRAMILYEKRTDEMQPGILFADSKNEAERTTAVRKYLRALKAGRMEEPAEKITVVSGDETYEEFTRKYKPGRIPLGYRIKDGKPAALPLVQLNNLAIYAGSHQVEGAILKNLFHAIAYNAGIVHVVRRNSGSLFLPGSEPLSEEAGQVIQDACGCTADEVGELLNRLIQEIQRKQDLRHQFCDENGMNIESWNTLRDSDRNAYLKELLLHQDKELIHESMKPDFVLFEGMGDLADLTNQANRTIAQQMKYEKAQEEAKQTAENSSQDEEHAATVQPADPEKLKKAHGLMDLFTPLLQIMSLYQIYLVPMQLPEDADHIQGEFIVNIARGSFILLGGGRYGSQEIATYFDENQDPSDTAETGYVYIQNKAYKMRFLLGKLADEETQDSDFAPIFEDRDG
ncbi:type VII secretion protein EssC [Anaerolactibacter massiliensis]|uniref:type VII secretion protein EssC n=1 Tax=Anaerolactibacter massiliensis TaxID=2044573 RepID=UPI000CF8EA1E|nr:type VII secretion protein EssC [Anaerolactibacter massiliensis]